MNLKIKSLLIFVCLLSILLLPAITWAANDIKSMLNDTAGQQGAGYDITVDPQTGLATIAGLLVRILLSLLGIIFICYTIYGGFLWMTAAGNEENVKKAKEIIKNGVIGLIVIVSAAAIYYAITSILISGSVQP